MLITATERDAAIYQQAIKRASAEVDASADPDLARWRLEGDEELWGGIEDADRDPYLSDAW